MQNYCFSLLLSQFVSCSAIILITFRLQMPPWRQMAPKCCHLLPRYLQDSPARTPQPGLRSQDSTARAPQPGFHSQDSTARIIIICSSSISQYYMIRSPYRMVISLHYMFISTYRMGRSKYYMSMSLYSTDKAS